jgi:Tol biopolymer transport system component
MILTQGAARVLRRTGKTAGVVFVLGAIAAGAWFGVSAFRNAGNDAASAGGSPLLIYSEFGRTSDTVWSALADDPARRSKLTTIDHAPEYGAEVALSPDGMRIAYVALPASGVAAIDAPAEVWVMDRDGRNRKRLAGDVDLPVAPVWATDGLSVVFRRSDNSDAAGHFRLVRVTADGAETMLVDSTDGLLPAGFAPDGSLYFIRLSPAGTDLGVVYASGGVMSNVAHLSDDFARDWHLSPDGTRLAYLSSRQNGDDVTYGAVVLNLSAVTAMTNELKAAAVPSDQGDEFNPIWRRDGTLTVGYLSSNGVDGASGVLMASSSGAATNAVAAPSEGFDVPLAWSLDAGYLAARYYEGNTVTNPGRSWVTVVGADGKRETVSSNSDVEVLGWVDSGG